MDEESSCTMFSYYKGYFGVSQGNLLRAFHNNPNLCFDGTSTNNCTVFSRENGRNTCSFYITRSGVKYGICEHEINKTICLKEDSASMFSIKRDHRLPDNTFIFIKSEKSGLYLTSDRNGKPVMCSWDDVKNDSTGLFILKECIDGIDEEDGFDPRFILEVHDGNNNAEPNFKPRRKTFCDLEVKEPSIPRTRSRSVQ